MTSGVRDRVTEETGRIIIWYVGKTVVAGAGNETRDVRAVIK
jgi:hypothetical protein